jgi:hypothetical protein
MVGAGDFAIDPTLVLKGFRDGFKTGADTLKELDELSLRKKKLAVANKELDALGASADAKVATIPVISGADIAKAKFEEAKAQGGLELNPLAVDADRGTLNATLAKQGQELQLRDLVNRTDNLNAQIGLREAEQLYGRSLNGDVALPVMGANGTLLGHTVQPGKGQQFLPKQDAPEPERNPVVKTNSDGTKSYFTEVVDKRTGMVLATQPRSPSAQEVAVEQNMKLEAAAAQEKTVEKAKETLDALAMFDQDLAETTEILNNKDELASPFLSVKAGEWFNQRTGWFGDPDVVSRYNKLQVSDVLLFTARTKGAISDKEMAFFRSTVPNPGTKAVGPYLQRRQELLQKARARLEASAREGGPALTPRSVPDWVTDSRGVAVGQMSTEVMTKDEAAMANAQKPGAARLVKRGEQMFWLFEDTFFPAAP